MTIDELWVLHQKVNEAKLLYEIALEAYQKASKEFHASEIPPK